VCLLAGDHRLAGGERMTLDDYLGCSHVVIDDSMGYSMPWRPRLDEDQAQRRSSRCS